MVDIAEVLQNSRFAKRSWEILGSKYDPTARDRYFKALIETPWTQQRVQALVQALPTDDKYAVHLRQLRREIVLSLLVRDVTHRGGYEEVVSTMSWFAQYAISRTVEVVCRQYARRFGTPTSVQGLPQDLIVVGMGKLGGQELNVSSDVDLIFLFDEHGQTVGAPGQAVRSIENQDFFTRVAREVNHILSSVEPEGFVFRVDMRLRPNGDSGPLVCSLSMLEQYLYAQGRDWERFAWLKGRVINTPIFMTPEAFGQVEKSIDALIKPFVFRKYLDFGAISSLNKLHDLIRAETDRRELIRGDNGVNVKLGRGGIREIEFLVQTWQVIRGGRNRKLQGKSTLAMLGALADEGILEADLASRLKQDYIFLRNVEHALQYVDDKQTHWLAKEGLDLECAARLLGCTAQDLWQKVGAIRDEVAQAFDHVFNAHQACDQQAGDTWPTGWPTGTSTALQALTQKLESLGYAQCVEEIATRMIMLMKHRVVKQLSDDARRRLKLLLEFVADNAISWCDRDGLMLVSPAEALVRYIQFIETIAGRSTYVSLLYQYPSIAQRLGRILAASRWCTDFICKHPIIIDELLDARIQHYDNLTPVDWRLFQVELKNQLQEAKDDQERQLNLIRDAHHGAIFRLLISDLEGHLSVEKLADHLSALADCIIQEVIELAATSMRWPASDPIRLAVIGYGKLGGKELSYHSDLDLVFIYDDAHEDAFMRYNRLVRRIINLLTLQTSSGKLFDVDVRLRPNGESGPAVVSLEMFKRYQANEDGLGAWLWEHQALTRARFVAGDVALGAQFEQARQAVLSAHRDPVTLRQEILKMRDRIAQNHATHPELLDVKYDRGGMIDVEFIVQYCVLLYSEKFPELMNNFGNIWLLEKCANLMILDEKLVREVVHSYRQYRAIQHEQRLSGTLKSNLRVPVERLRKEQQSVLKLWRAVFMDASVDCVHA